MKRSYRVPVKLKRSSSAIFALFSAAAASAQVSAQGVALSPGAALRHVASSALSLPVAPTPWEVGLNAMGPGPAPSPQNSTVIAHKSERKRLEPPECVTNQPSCARKTVRVVATPAINACASFAGNITLTFTREDKGAGIGQGVVEVPLSGFQFPDPQEDLTTPSLVNTCTSPIRLDTPSSTVTCTISRSTAKFARAGTYIGLFGAPQVSGLSAGQVGYASVAGADGGNDPAYVARTFCSLPEGSAPDLTSTATVAVRPDGTATFTVVSRNAGTEDVGRRGAVRPFAIVTAGLSGVVVSNGGIYNAATGVVLWPEVRALAAGAALTYTIDITVPPTVPAQAITGFLGTNISVPGPAPLLDDASFGNNTSFATTAAPPAAPSPTPTVDLATTTTGVPNGNGTATFTVTATNVGPSAAPNVKVTTTIATGLTGVVVSNGGTYTPATGMVMWPPTASLPADDALTFTITLPLPPGGSQVATTTVASFTNPGDTVPLTEISSANNPSTANVQAPVAQSSTQGVPALGHFALALMAALLGWLGAIRGNKKKA